MSYKIVDVEITGVTALIQNRFSEKAEGDLGAATRRSLSVKPEPREQAEQKTYREPDGTLYHPGAAIGRLLREAGSSHKLKGTRKSVKFVVPSAVLVLEDALPIFDGNGYERSRTFEVDSRPVVIPSTKGRIMCHRPRQDRWRMRFHLRINENVLPESLVHVLLVDGGQQLGIGDYRPEKGGPFGTFNVTKWEVS